MLVLLIASLLPAGLGCLFKAIPPCSCVPIAFKTTEITCKDATDANELEKSLLNLQNQSVQTLYIIDSSLMYLPSDVFKGLEVQKLHLINSTVQDLTESEVAFEGLGNSLEVLIIEECRIFNGFNWDEFRNLRNLVTLKTVKAGLLDIDSDIGDIAHLPLKELHLTQDSISYIDDRAFTKFKNLMILSLKRNHISVLKRSMFPNPAPKLTVINLSYNAIDTLPEDMFMNMPGLMSILLAGNNLITVDQKTFSSVWSQLNKINLYDNPMRCDCRMKWILLMKSPKNTWAECVYPPNLAGSNFAYLNADDLKC
ncbi:unnamed protein product [Larinioides sclopetarius]|uniref:Uncharacterized protein n=1 Tax=Larinioides sclopetarius TaxID=280406 RepID=A0AAV2AH77_9ARAC